MSYYRMHRGWMDNPAFADAEERMAWVWLIENAEYHGPLRGRVVVSQRKLAEEWGWDRSRVRRFLLKLQNFSMVTHETTHYATVLSICNYDKYQAPVANDDPLRDPRNDKGSFKEGLRDTNEVLDTNTSYIPPCIPPECEDEEMDNQQFVYHGRTVRISQKMDDDIWAALDRLKPGKTKPWDTAWRRQRYGRFEAWVYKQAAKKGSTPDAVLAGIRRRKSLVAYLADWLAKDLLDRELERCTTTC